MIRALIVDDEKITRKGMLSVIPWARFDIEIVDDLASGAAALEYLAEHAVDLVFVDVAMPGMNGIELIREMRARGMQCAVVVLTFYDDFEYVREAMRLGAVDYLLKTQLDDQKILDMLGRVTVLLGRRGQERGGAAHPAYFALVDLSGPGGFGPGVSRPGVSGPSGRGAAAAAEDLAGAARTVGSLEEGSIILEVPYTPQAEEQVQRAAAAHGVAAIRLTGPAGAAPDFQAVSDAALRSVVFYEHGRDGARLVIPFERLREKPPEVPSAALEELRDSWASAGWLLLERSFQELEERTCRLRPPAGALESIIASAVAGLAGAFPSLGSALTDALSSAAGRTWTEWRLLLERARVQARQQVHESRHSDDTVRKVLEGLEIIRKSDGRYVKEEVVAGRVGLSRSYFSRCFKDITGVEFRKFLMDKSITEAKGLLVRTAEPFRSISARLGYQSEAHFSRTFRSLTGLSPREFRTQHQSTSPQSAHPASRGDQH